MPGDAVIARLFGKLPAHGDFVCRGFGRATCDEYDRWLSAGLVDAQAEHGERFGLLYDRAVPWRYAVGDQVAGAIALSQDSAGRRFPVYVEVRPSSGANAAAVEELLCRAITERWAADELILAADRLAVQDGGVVDEVPGNVAGRWWLEGGGPSCRLAGERPDYLLSRMLIATAAVTDPAAGDAM